MKKILGWYGEDWIKIMFRPIYFYTFMEKGAWAERSLTFLLMSVWLLSFGLALLVFFAYVFPLLAVTVSGIAGYKLIAAGFVFFLLCLCFFTLILLALGGLFAAGSLLFTAGVAWALDRAALLFGEKKDFRETLKAVNYSSALSVVILLVPLLGILTKYRLLSFANFMAGTNLVLYGSLFYAWGLWSIAVKRNYGLSRKNALTATFMVVFLVLLLLMVASFKMIPSLERWIT